MGRKAATNTTATNEAIKSYKNIKRSSEVLNFYRFIHENNLRAEAFKLMDLALKAVTPKKKRGRKKATKVQ